MTRRALTFWPVSYLPSLILSHVPKKNQTTNYPSRVAAHAAAVCVAGPDSWHAVVIFLAHFTCRSLGFALWKIARPCALFTRQPGSGADQSLEPRSVRASCRDPSLWSPWKLKHALEVRKHPNYQRLLESHEGKCVFSLRWRCTVWDLCTLLGLLFIKYSDPIKVSSSPLYLICISVSISSQEAGRYPAYKEMVAEYRWLNKRMYPKCHVSLSVCVFVSARLSVNLRRTQDTRR